MLHMLLNSAHGQDFWILSEDFEIQMQHTLAAKTVDPNVYIVRRDKKYQTFTSIYIYE